MGAFIKFRMILNLNIHTIRFFFNSQTTSSTFFFGALPLPEVLEVTSPETPSATTLVAESLSDDSGKAEGYGIFVCFTSGGFLTKRFFQRGF